MRNDSPYGQIHVKYDNCTSYEIREPMTARDRKTLILTASILGFCVLAFHYSADIVVRLIADTPIAYYYANDNQIAFICVQVIYSFCSILIPFSIGGFFLQRIHPERDILPLNKPNSWKDLFFAMGIGFVSLVISNYITTFYVLAAEHFGIFFETGEGLAVRSVSDFFWQLLGTALVPALLEEFAIRGVFMQSLRKYGDIFAISVSAVLFALLHGNMVQAPFALILGCVIGWLVIVTDSLWTGIAIHFMNNTYALVMNTMLENLPESVYVIAFLVINAIGIMLGVMSFFRIDKRYKQGTTLYEPGGNTVGTRMAYRVKALFFTFTSLPMMVAVIVLMRQLLERIYFFGW